MTGYQWLLALHILCTVVWVGGGVTMQFLTTRAAASNDSPRMAALGGEAEWIGFHVFMPASILALISGIAPVVNGHGGGATCGWRLASSGSSFRR